MIPLEDEEKIGENFGESLELKLDLEGQIEFSEGSGSPLSRGAAWHRPGRVLVCVHFRNHGVRRHLAVGHAGEVDMSAKVLEPIILFVMGCFQWRKH